MCSSDLEWDFAQSTSSSETVDKKATVVHESKTTSEKPLGSSSGITAGLSSNTLDPEAPAAEVAGSNAPRALLLEKTSEETKEYAPSVSREQRVRLVPELKRLSVALFLDQSVKDAKALEAAIKAAVGFDEERSDEFSSVVLSFAAPAEPSATPTGEGTPAEPNPLVRTLLERGLEIASAIVFLVLLFRTLRGSRKEKRPAAAGQPAAEGEAQVDAELLARAQVDELLRSDPARVGEILSRWAREEPVGGRR